MDPRLQNENVVLYLIQDERDDPSDVAVNHSVDVQGDVAVVVVEPKRKVRVDVLWHVFSGSIELRIAFYMWALYIHKVFRRYLFTRVLISITNASHHVVETLLDSRL